MGNKHYTLQYTETEVPQKLFNKNKGVFLLSSTLTDLNVNGNMMERIILVVNFMRLQEKSIKIRLNVCYNFCTDFLVFCPCIKLQIVF